MLIFDSAMVPNWRKQLDEYLGLKLVPPFRIGRNEQEIWWGQEESLPQSKESKSDAKIYLETTLVF